MEAGDLHAEMVGTHHRIPAESLAPYLRARQLRHDRAAEALP